ncbi:MAG: ABC transporter permease [Methanomassiliicoccales archaeon]|nr:ABC transporter permease [Methanomassiliicoccales archaeon]
MKSVTNIIKKEVKELLTPAALVPIILMAAIFGSLGNIIGGAGDEAARPPVIGVIDQDGSALSTAAFQTLNKSAIVVYNGSSVSEGLTVLDEREGVALIMIPSDFSERITNNQTGELQVIWIMKGAGIMDSLSSTSVDLILQLACSSVSKVLIDQHSSVNSSVILNPAVKSETTIFRGKEMAGISPGAIAGFLSQQAFVVPLIVLMVIIMAGSMVISSMGTEKENKTLETLLTLPVRRSSIVFGKLAGSAIVGLILAIIYMVGLGYYTTSITAGGPIDLSRYGLTLDALDYVLVGISLFLGLLSALALCMLLGIFAKNYKSAQTLTMPITLLAMIPMFAVMMLDFNTMPLVGQVLLFAIPFTHPMMAIRSLMFDDYTLVVGGIVYEAAFAFVTMAIAVWAFRKDILLTGRLRKGGERPLNPIWRALFKMNRMRPR